MKEDMFTHVNPRDMNPLLIGFPCMRPFAFTHPRAVAISVSSLMALQFVTLKNAPFYFFNKRWMCLGFGQPGFLCSIGNLKMKMGVSKSTNLVRATMTVRARVGRQPLKMKVVIGVAAATVVLMLLWVFVNDHGLIFFTAELSHAAGISFLIYKLIKDRTCAGLSLKSQELTALFLALKIYCSYMTFDIHTILDLATLITTLWVVFMIRVVLKSSYMEEDRFPMQYLVLACALMALLVHPTSSDVLINRLILAFGCNLETVAIMPQLALMQNTKIVESLTAHYVFALGVTRFLSCAHWILQVVNSRGTILLALGYGFWPGMVLLSEIVQTSILADFCYYYIISVIDGHSVLRLPSDTV